MRLPAPATWTRKFRDRGPYPGWVAETRENDPYAAARDSAARLACIAGRIDAAVVLGSGWGAAVDAIGPCETEVPLVSLGGFAEPGVPGHQGSARVLQLGGVRVLAFLGRVHLYEGHAPDAVVHGVRTAIAAAPGPSSSPTPLAASTPATR